MCGVDGKFFSPMVDIAAGRPIKDVRRILDVASGTMVEGAVCSAAQPCWPIVQKPATITAADGTLLGSISARDLVGYYARGASVAWLRMEHLINAPLLVVAWAVDPDSFFFAYVRDGKLVAVRPPARPTHATRVPDSYSKAAAKRVQRGETPADEVLPAGVLRESLIVVARRRFLLMLFVKQPSR